ncbi:MAG: universal stress protein [Actinomycetota bacterium]|nr:universal stress protein [Actinomycetota bacterium]
MDVAARQREGKGRAAGPVVVGVDGSKASDAALEWAAEEARMRGATLRVVHSWSLPTWSYSAYLPPVAFEEVEPAAREDLDRQVAQVLGPSPDVRVEKELREGPAAEQILDAAADAALVVVGSRGRGGFAGLLLGSVSAQVVQHAHCPVTIVRT